MADSVKEILIKVSADVNPLKTLKTEQAELIKQASQLAASSQRESAAFKEVSTQLKNTTQAHRELNKEIREFTNNVPLSRAQLLELGENLTVIGFGLREAVTALVSFGKELHGLAEAGASFDIMYAHFVKMNGGIEQATEKFDLLKKASSGNFNDKEILDYINRLDQLGFTTETSTKLLDFAERQSDDLGLSINETTDKLTRFIETGKGKGFEQIGLSIADINKEMQKQSGLTEKQINNLTDESAAQLRLNAVNKLYFDSLDNINKKEKDHADKLVSVQKELDNAKLRMGSFVANGLIKLEEHLGLGTKGTSDFAVAIGALGKGAVNILPAIGGLATSVKGLSSSLKEAEGFAGLLKTGLLGLAAIGTIALVVHLMYKVSGFGGLEGQDMQDRLDEASLRNQALDNLRKKGFKYNPLSPKTNTLTEEDIKLEMGRLKVLQKNPITDLPDFKPDFNPSSGGKDKEKEKTWLEQQIELQKKLNADLIEFLRISQDVNQSLFVREKAFEEFLKTQRELGIGLSGLGQAKTIDFATGEEIKKRFISIDPRNEIFKGKGFAGELDSRTKELEELEDKQIDTGISLVNDFSSMLKTTGLMNDDFAKMLDTLMSFISVIQTGRSIISTILSFIPGGNVVGSGGGGGTGQSINRPVSGGMGNSVIQVHLHGEMSTVGSYKVLKTAFETAGLRPASSF